MLADVVPALIYIAVVVVLWLSVMRPAMGTITLCTAIVLAILVLVGFTLWGIVS